MKRDARKLMGVCSLISASLILFANALFSAASTNEKITLAEAIDIITEDPTSPEKVLKSPWAFAVTEDQLFLIPDFRAGNIKVYENVFESGKQVLRQIALIGQKGYGPEGLVRPTTCDFAKKKFAVMDYGLRKIIVYDRESRLGFKRVKEITCWEGVHDIQLKGDILFISGYTTDSTGNIFDFYSIDLYSGEKRYLLPYEYKFGFKRGSDALTISIENQLPTIGLVSWFGIYEDDAYIAWEGDLKIIRLNTASGMINEKTFGAKAIDYVKPYASLKLIEARRSSDNNLMESEKLKMSYVRAVFVSPMQERVFLLYEGPIGNKGKTGYRLQSYTLDGDYIEEHAFPGKPAKRFWFEDGKEKIVLYSLVGEYDASFFILKYELSRWR